MSALDPWEGLPDQTAAVPTDFDSLWSDLGCESGLKLRGRQLYEMGKRAGRLERERQAKDCELRSLVLELVGDPDELMHCNDTRCGGGDGCVCGLEGLVLRLRGALGFDGKPEQIAIRKWRESQ